VGRYVHDGWAENLGIASIPGTSYVGGVSFVIWQYSKHYNEAFELIRFLSSQPTSIPGSPHTFELPTRRDALNMPSAETDVFHRTYLQALQNGRSFPTIRLWGSIEDKLIAETANVWAELFANPNTDLDKCIHRHYDLLAERLNIILEN
jgi:ABC-type glycerol-3-phosphate transport system substrate-binding protein